MNNLEHRTYLDPLGFNPVEWHGQCVRMACKVNQTPNLSPEQFTARFSEAVKSELKFISQFDRRQALSIANAFGQGTNLQ